MSTVFGVMVVLLLAGIPAVAQPAVSRSEEQIESSSPVTDVVGSVVSVLAPLPPDALRRPPECDYLSYLRWRSVDGPTESTAADRILVAQPGIYEGAGAFESVARNTVSAAAAAGSHIEFWALDRRSNCMEDHTGTQAALAARDLTVASDYYYGGAEVDGRRFGGFVDGDATAWLARQGLEQTLRDQYDVMRIEMPDPAMRKQKMLCGGHSLGGFVTGYFAEWDFDGNPGTLDDAGFNQCAGYFALDTIVKAGTPPLLRGIPDLEVPRAVADPIADLAARVDGALPVLRLPAVINPETTNLLAMAGVAASIDPDGVNDLVDVLPRNTNIDATLRVLLSKDTATAATGSPSVRTLNATNDAVLGALLDDNSQPFGFLQASVGFIGAQPVVDKSFPTLPGMESLPVIGSALGDARKAAPAVFGDPDVVYTWNDYDALDGSEQTARYTDSTSEVTSITQLARSLAEPPLDFTEWYFPTALTFDLAQSGATAISGHRIHRDGADRSPILTLQGSGGIDLPPSGHPNDTRIVVQGYNHLDVLTAAQTQNNGLPEVVSTELARFAADPEL
ncbi:MULTISPECIES: hypothetical protein [unclassified Rhodococcus (in: high G+C Gram-positive bacteria)]|uniref:hypothetical protein n=2 Tax=unclassified Rhodococcus (in: high G+C Gram-positive bacteria) TaxID=192944 RepID=UPI0021BFA992|nr:MULTISPECIES: hypothetical protein [unclassified Rhodococcus (in: high G+C Gram-positive bacteria)]